MVIGTNADFIGEVDRGPFSTGPGFDGSIGFSFPLLHKLPVLLPRLVERLLRRETKQFHDAADRSERQRFAELPLDQFADQRQCPQTEFELELLRGVATNSLSNPTHFVGTDLRRPTRDRFCEQCILAALGKLREPAENGPHAQAERRRDTGTGSPSRTALTACWRMTWSVRWSSFRPSDERLHFIQRSFQETEVTFQKVSAASSASSF